MELKIPAWGWALAGGLLVLLALTATALPPATAAPPQGPGAPATVVPTPCATCPPPTPTPNPSYCLICDPNDPFYRYWFCWACGAWQGGPPVECRSNNTITRGQIAKIVVVAANLPLPVPTTQETFADVPITHPFWLFIEQLAMRGITGGYACGGPGEPCDWRNRPYFRAYNPTTRGQVAKLVIMTANIQDPIPSTQQTFADIPPGSPVWLWVERLAGRGAISGYACGSVGEPCDPQNRPYFRPNNWLTRGQAVKIVVRIFNPTCASAVFAP